jgi:hypothetical protein
MLSGHPDHEVHPEFDHKRPVQQVNYAMDPTLSSERGAHYTQVPASEQVARRQQHQDALVEEI